MLVEARDVEEFEEDIPTRKPPRPQLRVRSGLDEEYSSDEIEKMTLLYEGTLSNIQEGEIVKSKVLRVTDTAVILDVGFKSEGAVAIDEFKDPRSLKEGDEVEVFLEHLEDQEGAVVLSKKKADFMRVWERIREAHEKDEGVTGTLVKKIKGGVVVDLMGVDAFLPGSQIALRRVPNIDELLGQSFEFRIIKLDIDWERERISLGLKQLQPYPWQNVAAKYPVGTRVQGKVVSITNYGAFVELEPGIEGLVHISEMSWTRNVRHPSKLVSIGESIEAGGLKVAETEEKVSL